MRTLRTPCSIETRVGRDTSMACAASSCLTPAASRANRKRRPISCALSSLRSTISFLHPTSFARSFVCLAPSRRSSIHLHARLTTSVNFSRFHQGVFRLPQRFPTRTHKDRHQEDLPYSLGVESDARQRCRIRSYCRDLVSLRSPTELPAN